METISDMENATRDATKPAIVEEFSIDGLYGYRSVGLSSKHAATVLIARNGSGKTTLIAALDAFLRGQFTRFIGLDFAKVTCKLAGHPDLLILMKSDIESLAQNIAVNSELVARAKSWEIEPTALLELLELDISKLSNGELYDHPTFNAIYQKTGYDINGARLFIEKTAESIETGNLHLTWLRKTVRGILGKTEILYLPTYRRIELSLPEPDTRRVMRKKSVLSRLGVAKSGLHTADIQFGLGDISDRLKSLYSEMLSLSNRGYGKVSANIINDLISGYYKTKESSGTLPSKDSLQIFFSRIKEADREFHNGPFNGPYRGIISTPDLERVYTGDVPTDAKLFLNYFLDQLGSVIAETRGLEESVEAFITNCNRYLSGSDKSTDGFSNSGSYDSKELTFNRKNLEVKVTTLANNKEVPIEALSSGEKQMISLFALLYLYPAPKIILIDEPELSLSISWQKQILPDVLKAPNCKQVIAITHSPFIFDNELEDYAGALRLHLTPNMDDDGDLNPNSRVSEE